MRWKFTGFELTVLLFFVWTMGLETSSLALRALENEPVSSRGWWPLCLGVLTVLAWVYKKRPKEDGHYLPPHIERD